MAALCGVLTLVLAIVVAAVTSSFQRTCRISPITVDFGPLPDTRTGQWASEFNIQSMEKFGVGCEGPEDVDFDKEGRAYTGCADGWVKRLHDDGKIENFTYTGGRPLGIAVGGDPEVVYVADAYLGLFKVLVDDRVPHLIASEDDEGNPINLADGVAIGSDGAVYFTDASSKFKLGELLLDFWEMRPNGRLLKYEPLTNTTSVVLRDLGFPNGVAVSGNEDFLVIAETSRGRLLRLWLKGEKKATVEVFMHGLPGLPDNVKYHDGHFYVGIVGKHTPLLDWLCGSPYAVPLKCILLQLPFIDEIARATSKSIARLIVVDEQGQLVKKYEDPTGTLINYVTGGTRSGPYVYLSGLGQDFIGRVRVA